MSDHVTNPVDTMRLLDPMTMPLTGRSVIEASAGTGKTFTITTLYVRLLLGLDDGDLPPLSVDQLLVMTFTEAATEEIRDRVRKRLQDVKTALLDARETSDLSTIDDPILRGIVQQLTQPAVAFGRIDAALKSLDEAAIFTIHGFCHRMLQQHAFESRSLFEETFIMDETELLQRVTRDYWRREVPQQQGLVLEVLQATWQHPDLLLREVRGLLSRQFETILPEISWQATLNRVDDVVEHIQRIKKSWLSADIAGLLADSDLKANAKAKKPEQLQAMQRFCESNTLRPGKLDIKAWSVEALSKPSMLKGSKRVPLHPVFDIISDYLQLASSIEQDIRAAFLQQALNDIVQRRDAEKQRLHYLSPDDLLTRLATALKQDTQGVLAAAIRKQFPAMMIDEFQDTDPLQYQIVDQIYPEVMNTTSLVADSMQDMPDTEPFSVIMIGDPKQAIYGFRGADIFTYIHAKRAVNEAKRFTLGTNWRSSAPMIHAVNQLFMGAQQGFLYQDDIPFQPVNAAHADKHAECVIGGEVAPSMHVWRLSNPDGPMTQTQCKTRITDKLVAEIVQLLHQGEAKQTLIDNKPLVASDMAVLVRDRTEAKMVREALRNAGVGSVFITRQSVFDSDFALSLFQLLNAIYHEKNEASIRALLVGPFFGFSVQQVLQLNDNEVHWQQLLQQVQTWKQQWLRFGVLAMLQHVLMDNDLASVWRSHGWDVERLLTDFRHLGELLQEKSMQVEGPHRLLNWFRQQLQAEQQAEGFRLRLESDEKLVQIVTWHASKGLEYPVVFLPFAVNYRESKETIFHQENALVLDLSPHSNFQSAAQREQLAEDIRLLYVALTRPVYRCYVGVYDVKYGARKRSVLPLTAMGSLLNLDPDTDNQFTALNEALAQWQSAVNSTFNNALTIEALTLDIDENQQALTNKLSVIVPENSLHARAFTGQIHRDWHVTSYSALSHNAASTHIQPGGTDEQSAHPMNQRWETNKPSEAFTESAALFWGESPDLTEAQQAERGEPSTQYMPANFPKGANAGSCLHYILENIDFTNAHATLHDVVTDALAVYGIDAQWIEPTVVWMQQVLDTPLFSGQIATELAQRMPQRMSSDVEPSPASDRNLPPTLADISPANRLVEMEFFLPMQRVTASALTRIVQQHLREIRWQQTTSVASRSMADSRSTDSIHNAEITHLPQLNFAPVQGVLKGFIDLLFCHNNQYFVLDYKSNWLGEQPTAYSQQAMHDAMLSHHYHLQYLLYVLALHRFLKQRQPNYEYDTHIGGVVYAFLRGMQGEQAEPLNEGVYGTYYQRPSWAIIEQLDELFAGTVKTTTSPRHKKAANKPAAEEQLLLWDEHNAEAWQGTAKPTERKEGE